MVYAVPSVGSSTADVQQSLFGLAPVASVQPVAATSEVVKDSLEEFVAVFRVLEAFMMALAATIGGGSTNVVSSTANYGTIGGGGFNAVNGHAATVGGGGNNLASGYAATVGGGDSNHATGNAATVGGGDSNLATDLDATVGGGVINVASNDWATVAGGGANTASYGSSKDTEETRADLRWQYSDERFLNEMHITHEDSFFAPRPVTIGPGYNFVGGPNRDAIINLGGGRDYQDKGQKGYGFQNDFTIFAGDHTLKMGFKYKNVEINAFEQQP